jgi:hypothetical protein
MRHPGHWYGSRSSLNTSGEASVSRPCFHITALSKRLKLSKIVADLRRVLQQGRLVARKLMARNLPYFTSVSQPQQVQKLLNVVIYWGGTMPTMLFSMIHRRPSEKIKPFAKQPQIESFPNAVSSKPRPISLVSPIPSHYTSQEYHTLIANFR